MAKRSPKHLVTTPDEEVLEKRVKVANIPALRKAYLKHQEPTCPLCERPLEKLTQHLDHCHTTGFIRGVLCGNCNSMEGKLKGALARMDTQKLGAEYMVRKWLNWQKPKFNRHIHPNAETKEERKERQKKRAKVSAEKRKIKAEASKAKKAKAKPKAKSKK